MRAYILGAVLLVLLPACAPREAVRPAKAVPRLEVISCMLAASRDFVDVRFRISGVEAFDPEPANTYLLDEATGQKFYIARLQRIGRMAETRSAEETPVHFVMFKNRGGILKIGRRVTLVVGPARQEHIQVGP